MTLIKNIFENLYNLMEWNGRLEKIINESIRKIMEGNDDVVHDIKSEQLIWIIIIIIILHKSVVNLVVIFQ